ncbi:MAG: fatty acid cis/trans isomerase [Parahaliea sp.]
MTDEAQPERGVLYRLLELKQAHPLSASGPVDDTFDFSLSREHQCPRQDDFDRYARQYPLWGMPFGLPGLNTEEHQTLVRWLEAGAPGPERAILSMTLQAEFDAWERFLNGNTPKQRLMARYVYEHLFLATLFLQIDDHPTWFRLVRSVTPPGKPIQLIATRRPYDDPGVDRVYYRLQRMSITPLGKSHLAYRFDRQRREWYRELFLAPDYAVRTLPGYAADIAANPFKSFAAIPVRSRYRFLLREAEFTIMNFIKGPVCRGQVALNVIEDRFWVMFMDPDTIDPELDSEFLAQESDNLRLPTSETDGLVIDLLTWRQYAEAHKRYQKAKVKFLTERLDSRDRPNGLDLLWDGDGHNPNASLTIFRHFDTASVVKGFVGDTPKTAWVISYSLLERIHYLLVAGFDVSGAVGHQLETRLYMVFLRMEGELNFLMFLPPKQRLQLRDYWYRKAPSFARDHVFVDSELMREQSLGLSFSSNDPKAEFLGWMRERVYHANAPAYDYHLDSADSTGQALDALVAAAGSHNSFMPQVSFLRVAGSGRDQNYSLLRDSGYTNIAMPFLEQARRLQEEDRLTVARGFIGEHPNLFFQVDEKDLPRFAADIQAMKTLEDWQLLRFRYGVARNNPAFWPLSDHFHQRHLAADPLYHGLFDFNRYLGNE